MGVNDVKTMEIAESEKSKKVDEAQSVKCKFDFE
jgi:hypothetical protein